MTLSLSLRKVFSVDNDADSPKLITLKSAQPGPRMDVLDSRQTRSTLVTPDAFNPPAPDADDGLDLVTRLATRLFEAPLGAIIALDENDRWPRSRVGSAEDSWLNTLPPLIPSEADRPVFTGDAGETFDQGAASLAFQAVAPLIAPDGRMLGLLRVADHKPHVRPGEETRVAFAALAALAAKLLAFEAEITARKAEEQQRETLVAELDHRVKNVLAAVQSLAAQSARRASSLEGFLKTFSGRLKSMASAHQLLTATRWRGAGMQNIAAAELGGLAPGQTRWRGPDILLNPRAANAMSLALHELATNAVKFGALSVDTGRVEVDWRGLEDGGLSLSWVERGGPLVANPARRGFGCTLLEKVTGRELSGEARISFSSEGVRATILAGRQALAEPADKHAPTPRPSQEAPTLTGASAGAPLAHRAAQIRGLKVLIVEDAVLLALELEAGLQEAGAEVVGCAADLSEALGMVDLAIDAAVLDANLNGVSSLPVAEALMRRGVPFIFATGYGDNQPNPAGFDVPVIRKPYDVTQVAAALAGVTGRT
jgi:two-component sensor histidine kinase/CheY-like chemotaxis protein